MAEWSHAAEQRFGTCVSNRTLIAGGERLYACKFPGDCLPRRPSEDCLMRTAIIAAIAAVGGLLFGYDTGVISGALLFLREAFHLSSFMLGVVTSIALAGAAGGAAIAGLLADRFGRRPVLIATAMIFIAGALLAALADSLTSLLGGRLLVGIGIGGASMLTPLYLSEIAPAPERGALVSFNQLALTSGILASYLVGYGLAASGAWRWMLGLGAVPGVILAFGMLSLP